MALLSLSLQAVYDGPGNRVFDARLIVTAAGTNIPAPAYADAGYDTLLPNPVKLRGNGTWPVIYLQPGAYRLRITDARNNLYDTIENLTIPTENDGSGGGGGTVDDKRLNQTGDIKDRYGVGSHSGWVRCNGRNIGSSASSATERANDDCEALFSFLWTQDPNLEVSGGRGANAASDWAQGKTIALPDMRGRARFALDDLGTTAAGRLTGGKFTVGNATTLGSFGGEASHVQTVDEMPAHNHTVTATMAAAGGHNHTGMTEGAGEHNHSVVYRADNGYQTIANGFPGVSSVGAAGASPNATGFTSTAGPHTHTFTTTQAPNHTHALTVSCANKGSGAAMSWLPPFVLVSTYLKL